jgi:hypothetical protein
MIFRINSDYFLNSIDSLTFVMEKQCVSCKAGTELLNTVQTEFHAPGHAPHADLAI